MAATTRITTVWQVSFRENKLQILFSSKALAVASLKQTLGDAFDDLKVVDRGSMIDYRTDADDASTWVAFINKYQLWHERVDLTKLEPIAA